MSKIVKRKKRSLIFCTLRGLGGIATVNQLAEKTGLNT